ncbi:RsmD family RNA methyltransferase, partial [candidate division KSB1 bacterium]|nr:RsmD family RNA methyltransferase [candidate division KSB1 bacterium]
MRVIAGSCKGRVLFSPRGNLIRPTSDRIKEFIFDYLGPKIENASVLDLFSGTGNLSIEALSRGADLAILVDKSKEAIRLIY